MNIIIGIVVFIGISILILNVVSIVKIIKTDDDYKKIKISRNTSLITSGTALILSVAGLLIRLMQLA